MYIIRKSRLLSELFRLQRTDPRAVQNFLDDLCAAVEGPPNPGEHATPELTALRERLVTLGLAARIGDRDHVAPVYPTTDED